MLFLPKMPKHRDISAFRKVLKAIPHKGLGGIKKDIKAKDAYILALKRLCISKGAHCVASTG